MALILMEEHGTTSSASNYYVKNLFCCSTMSFKNYRMYNTCRHSAMGPCKLITGSTGPMQGNCETLGRHRGCQWLSHSVE